MQLVYQIIASYFEDNCADELTNDPVMTAILDKEALASQPTLSRFWNRMDGDTLSQLDMIQSKMRGIVYSVVKDNGILLEAGNNVAACNRTSGKRERHSKTMPFNSIAFVIDLIICAVLSLSIH